MLAPAMMTNKARNAASIAIALLGALALAACEKGRATVGPDDPACGSCASVFANGGIPCADTASSDAYDALLRCACDKCSVECSDSLCSATASNDTCGKCLEMRCYDVSESCADN